MGFRKLIGFFTSFLFVLSFTNEVNSAPPFYPQVISTPGLNASEPRCAVDLNGNVVAVWVEDSILKSNITTVGGVSWGAITPISNMGASTPSLKIDQMGTATALWLENGEVKSAFCASNGTWSTPETLSISTALSPSLAIDVNGNLVSVWEEDGMIMSSTQLLNGSWSSPPDILSGAEASFPQVAIGGDGTVVAVWEQIISGRPDIYAAAKGLMGNWGAAQAVSSAEVHNRFPKVAVDNNGNATALWFSYDFNNSVYSNVVVQSSEMPSNGSWETPVNISKGGAMDPSNLTSNVVLDSSNNAYAVWSTSMDGSLYDIQWNRRSNGKWDYLAYTLVIRNLYSSQVSAAIDAQGAAYNFWTFFSPNSSLAVQGTMVYFAKPLLQLSVESTISNDGQNASPYCSSNLTGINSYGIGTWVHYDGTSNVIQAIANLFPPVPSPTNLSVVQQSNDYHVYVEQYNLLSWQPSPAPNILYYFIYRNGVNVAIVPSSVLQYIDHNQSLGGTVTYTIYAYDSSFRYSQPVSIIFSN